MNTLQPPATTTPIRSACRRRARASTWPRWPTTTPAACTASGWRPTASPPKCTLTSRRCWPPRPNRAPRSTPFMTMTASETPASTSTTRWSWSAASPAASQHTAWRSPPGQRYSSRRRDGPGALRGGLPGPLRLRTGLRRAAHRRPRLPATPRQLRPCLAASLRAD